MTLDPEKDPDRYRSDSGRGGTLPEMLGEGAHEERDTLEWLYGLLGVLAFLVLVSLLINYL